MKPTVDIDLRLEAGSFRLEASFESRALAIGLFGASGAGKSTVLEAVAGWRRDVVGRIAIRGRVLLDSSRGIHVSPRERGIGYVPQDLLLFPHFDVRENIRSSARGGDASAADFEKAVDVLGLERLLDRGIHTLSGGEGQRVALARALCSEPEILLFDEALAALDRPLRRRILPYLVRVREAFDVPLLFVSHDATEVQALCEEVAILDGGSVVAQGPPAAVLGDPERASTEFENVLHGSVELEQAGTANLLTTGTCRVQVPRRDLAHGARAIFGLRADDIIVAPGDPGPLSARNLLPARIESLHVDGQDVRMLARLEGESAGPPLLVSLTTGAVEELQLAQGRRVHLVFKTQSCHRLG